MSSLPASIERIGSKTTEKRWRHRFPHYKSMGAFCCHGNQSFDPIFSKTLCSLSPTPVMLHIKFDQDWPTGFRDIQVWKCGRRTTTDDDGRRTDDGPLVYYKLTLWAFGSGELKIWTPEKWCNYPKTWTIWFYHRVMPPTEEDWMANTVDPDQAAPEEQSDLDLHCLPRDVCLKNFGSLSYKQKIFLLAVRHFYHNKWYYVSFCFLFTGNLTG